MMLDKKLATVILNGAIVFGGVLIGAGIKDLQHKIKTLTMQNQIKDIVIEVQRKIIEESNNTDKKES